MNPLKALTQSAGRWLATTNAGNAIGLSSQGWGGSHGGNGWLGIGYDATRSKGRRAQPGPRVLSEDQELRQYSRRILTTNLRDLNRNFAIAAWLIRRHLDYVSSFHFRSKTGEKDLDAQIETFMAWWALPANCDPAGRHSLQRLTRMWEMRRTIDGDVLVNRLADGRIQTIEGDRIQSEGGIPFQDLGIEDSTYVVNGVWINDNGRAKMYMVFRRPPQNTGLFWDKGVSARFADLFGYFDRIDQVRGISPLASAANTLRDTYEGFEYALLKAKVSQFFAMLITRKQSDDFGAQQVRIDETEPNADPDKPKYDVDMGRGAVIMDMDEGDDAKVIESQQPSDQFQSYSKLMIMVSLKALDIPFSFFDESHTNFAGSRMAGVQYYDAAVKIKQHDLRLLLDKLTRWRLGLAVADGQVKLPKGVKFTDLKWEWSHAATPLYDPMKERNASIAAIGAGLSSPQREAKKEGNDVFELIDEIAAVQKYAKSKGVILSTALATDANADVNKPSTEAEDENIEEEEQKKLKQPVKHNMWGDFTSAFEWDSGTH